MYDDSFRRVTGVVDDLDIARLDDEELEIPLACREENLPVAIELRSGSGAASQVGDLVFVQRGESYGLETVFNHNFRLPQGWCCAVVHSCRKVSKFHANTRTWAGSTGGSV